MANLSLRSFSLLAVLLVGCIEDTSGGGEWAAASLRDPVVGAASVWGLSAALHRCREWSLAENYSTGRFNVHRFRVELPAGGPVTVRFARTAGVWEPAILVSDVAGAPIVTAAGPTAHATVTATVDASGRGSDAAALTLQAATATTVQVYVTGWSVIDGGYATFLPRTAKYLLSMAHECAAGTWQDLHVGIDLDGSVIPHEGVANGTLRRTLGRSVEPYGTVEELDDMELVRGKISWFGGPQDFGVGPNETCAISGEVARRLNSPMNASRETIDSRPDDFYYAAMRFDYAPNGRAFWADARLLVVNPDTQVAVVVRPADWGPNTSTRRIIDLSPQTLEDLGLDTNDEVLVSFALPDSPLGPVQ